MAALTTELSSPLSAREAVLEADRCLECGGAAGAPCVTACPADVDVPAFVAAIAAGDTAAAARTIFAANILGGSCARVCPVEELCASGCVLLHEGRPAIEIGRLQRFATEWAFDNDLPLRPAPRTHTHRKVAVIGGGPAGLAAAGELAARGHTVTVFDERREPGGLVRYAIAPYRQANEPLPDEARLLGELGVEIRQQTTVDQQLLRALEAECDAIVLAVGMGGDAEVSYPGDSLDGVWESLPFIEALKTGAPPEVGERVVVIGGGNTAVDCAVEAARLGAQRVTMVYRRTEAEMPAYPHEIELARAEGVGFEWLTVPTAFLGGITVRAVACRRMRLGEPDESGRSRPEEVPGSDFELYADTVIKAIGQRPRAEFLALVPGLELKGGRIAVDELGRTGNPKYFAAGDAVNGGATVVEAVGGAKRAVRAIEESWR